MGRYVSDHAELRAIIAGHQDEGRRVVFTNGVFDLLHVGHVRALADARSRGDFLVVGVNSDSSVAELKSPELPLNPENERIEILCALECVDYVTLFSDRSADPILLELRPDIHAKGTDYTEETVPERETVLSYGGRIAIVGDPKDHASSSLLERLLEMVRRKNDA
jgi:rfaE bifunctional protein nucleotidyltransferase chain/domain